MCFLETRGEGLKKISILDSTGKRISFLYKEYLNGLSRLKLIRESSCINKKNKINKL